MPPSKRGHGVLKLPASKLDDRVNMLPRGTAFGRRKIHQVSPLEHIEWRQATTGHPGEQRFRKLRHMPSCCALQGGFVEFPQALIMVLIEGRPVTGSVAMESSLM
ncbi:hypothetical protein MRX96_040152 [Rhipicephalus microplus]